MKILCVSLASLSDVQQANVWFANLTLRLSRAAENNHSKTRQEERSSNSTLSVATIQIDYFINV